MAGLFGNMHTRATGGQYVDIVEDLSGAVRFGGIYQVPFYAGIARKFAKDTTHKWITDAPHTLSGVTGAVLQKTAGATTLTVTSATCTNFRINQAVRIENEWLLITAQASTALTVTRGYASTTRTTHATSLTVVIVDKSHLENAGPTAYATTHSEVSNQCQIFIDAVSLSRTRQRVASVVGSEWDLQVLKQGLEQAREIERAMLHGKIVTATANTTRRHMRGIVDAISTTRRTTTTSLTTARLATFFQAIYDQGGSPAVCVVDSLFLRALSNLNLGYVQLQGVELGKGTIGGMTAGRWQSPYGDMGIMLCRNLGGPIGQSCCCLALTPEEVAAAVIDEMLYEELAQSTDGKNAQIVSELCVEWGNQQFHGWLGNKSTGL
ncbi:MAG TPA: DUF5309 family protein [Planctomycetota bacterium]|nr:DUF5309 family protein [Planctomycetota bacterium]